MATISWRVGFEIELLAPAGKTRRDLANAIAQDQGGSVQRYFHPQSEPSKVPGTPVFHNLTLGFKVLDASHNWIASCVDDLTLQADLVRSAAPRPDWYRVISDDERLLRLIRQQTDPTLPLSEVMEPIARLFGTEPNPGPGGMVRVNDTSGASIAIAAPLPGERERPCELITAPLDMDHYEKLERLLGLARSAGFTVPKEGATHLHFDATALQSAGAMANLVQLLWAFGEPLKHLLGTNPNCRRLGSWPPELIEVVSKPGFRELSWSEAQAQLKQVKLTKYCDFNLINCINGQPDQNTIEVRILPVWLDSGPILEATALFVAVLQRALNEEPIPHISANQATVDRLVDVIGWSPGPPT
jgi:Putative amidoligase enzyme